MSQYPAQPPGSYPPGPYPPPGQYPSPYPSPYPGYPPQHGLSQAPFEEHLAPFVRSAVMLFITGGLMAACGILCAAMPWQMLMQQAAMQGQASPMPELSPEMISTMFRVVGVMTAVAGVVNVVLGFFVRKGSGGVAIAAIVVTVIELLAVLSQMVGPLFMGMGRGAEAILAICMLGIPAAAFVLTLVWLVQAYKAAPKLRAAQAQYQYLYWQYAQAQQGYGSYGQAAPPPPPTSSQSAGGPPDAPAPPAPPPDWPPAG